LRRILVHVQDTLKTECSKYSVFNATQQMGGMTNNIVQVITFSILLKIN